MTNDDFRNELMLRRRMRGFTRKQVAQILGYQTTTTLARIEQGKLIPPLPILLKLEILYRRPLGSLYPDLYAALRKSVHSAEASMPGRVHKPEEVARA